MPSTYPLEGNSEVCSTLFFKGPSPSRPKQDQPAPSLPQTVCPSSPTPCPLSYLLLPGITSQKTSSLKCLPEAKTGHDRMFPALRSFLSHPSLDVTGPVTEAGGHQLSSCFLTWINYANYASSAYNSTRHTMSVQ